MTELGSTGKRPPLRALRRVVLSLLTISAVYLALLIHPQPLFAYTLQRSNLILHARAPLPAEAGPMLAEALRRVSRSPLYQPERTYDVFLCGTPGMYAFLTGAAKGRGVTNFWGNVFIRPADVASGQVFGRTGEARGGEYTLPYYVAHEVTHAMEGAHRGLRLSRHPSVFQWEGYSDYVGLAHPIDLAAGRAAIRRDAPEMDVGRTGLYRRYELLVAYLLDHQGMTVEALLATRMNQKEVERELDADPTL